MVISSCEGAVDGIVAQACSFSEESCKLSAAVSSNVLSSIAIILLSTVCIVLSTVIVLLVSISVLSV